MASYKALKLCETLAKMGALAFGDYVLKSGLRSMYYVNTAVLANDVKIFSLAVDVLRELVESVTGGAFDKIVSPLGKGTAFAPPLAIELGKPFALVGEEGVVMGSINAEEEVVLVDDVVSTGSTLASCVRRVKEEGAVVEHAFTLLDRNEGAKERLSELGISLHSVFSIKELAEALYSMGFISEEERAVLLGEA